MTIADSQVPMRKIKVTFDLEWREESRNGTRIGVQPLLSCLTGMLRLALVEGRDSKPGLGDPEIGPMTELEATRWTSIPAALADVRARVTDVPCAACGEPAVCVGAYEGGPIVVEAACGECCAHGNEDGRCEMIEEGT